MTWLLDKGREDPDARATALVLARALVDVDRYAAWVRVVMAVLLCEKVGAVTPRPLCTPISNPVAMSSEAIASRTSQTGRHGQ